MIDTHAHLHFPKLAEQIAVVLERAQAVGVTSIINVASDLAGAEASIALAEQYPQISATVGIHPHDAAKFEQWVELERLIQHPKVVAVGEIGLDYCKNYCPVDRQKEVFERQLFLALKYQKPIIIHNREADQDVFDHVAQLDYPKIVYHCYSSDVQYAHKLLSKGYLLSFTANITYPKNENLRSVVKAVPLEKIMVETDCPFLAPHGLRGQTNEPANLQSVVQCIAEIKGLTVTEVAEVTARNAQEFFKS